MTSANDAFDDLNVNIGISPKSNLDVCPRCFEVVNPNAVVCRACQFEIFKYAENLRQCKVLLMAKAAGDNHRVWLMNHYRKTTGSLWIWFVIVGILVAFVPFVGVIAAPIMFFCAFIFLVAPARSSMLLEFLFSHRTYKEKVALARRTAENTYTDVYCPKCNHCFASSAKQTIYGWPMDALTSLKCPTCFTVSARVMDKLVWVPYPLVALKGSLAEYIP